MVEMDDELSDEDDYDQEDEEDDVLFPSKEEDESKETGVNPVEVDVSDPFCVFWFLLILNEESAHVGKAMVVIYLKIVIVLMSFYLFQERDDGFEHDSEEKAQELKVDTILSSQKSSS